MELFENKDALEKIYESRIGRILKIYQQNKFDPSDNRLFCDLEVFPSGTFTNMPIYGGGVDFQTKFPHGIFALPRKDQLVVILFLESNFQNPMACLPIPYNYDGADQYKDLFNNLVESVDDIGLYHYSGTRQIFRANGNIDIQKRIKETTTILIL